MAHYAEVTLAKINPEAILPADIFVLVGGKHIKFKHKGEAITKEKYDHFLAKSVSSIFLESEDVLEFIEWINENRDNQISELVKEAGEGSQEMVEGSLAMKDEVYEVFSAKNLTPERVVKMQGNVQDFVGKMKNDPTTAHAIKAIMGKNDDIASHSVSVANLATFLAMSSGHGSSFTLENIYLGAIFHDYGKARIPADILNNPSHPDYESHMKLHPENSIKIIQKSEGISDQVFKIILQHHEYIDGTGYPEGLKGSNVHTLSQIVSMANEIDNLFTSRKDVEESVRYTEASKLLVDGYGKKWDQSFFPRITEAFDMAFLGK